MTAIHSTVRLLLVVTGLVLAALAYGTMPNRDATAGAAFRADSARAQCASSTPSWVAAWAHPTHNTVDGYDRQSVRVVLKPNFAGHRARIRLSNALGKHPVTLSGVHIGRVASGATLVPGTNHPLRFSGASRVTIPAGGTVLSDPTRLRVRAFEPIAVSYYAPRYTGPATGHDALATTYIAGGQHTADHGGAADEGEVQPGEACLSKGREVGVVGQ
jgi:hypothetical protein